MAYPKLMHILVNDVDEEANAKKLGAFPPDLVTIAPGSEFPKMIYGPNGEQLIVNNAAEQKEAEGFSERTGRELTQADLLGEPEASKSTGKAAK